MGAILFVREDLFKATHKELKWINAFTDKHGYVHRAHHKHVLVADDHDNTKVATGQGSFYQKIAHKNAMADIPNFQSLDIDHQANIILHHATGLQSAASASAALSGFKASMLAGKVPTTAQYLAMVDAPSKTQGKVADACAAAIGDEKYEQLLFAASAKAKQTKGKSDVVASIEAVKTSPQGLPQGATPASANSANAAKPAEVSQPIPPIEAALIEGLPLKVKAKLDDWAVDGYVGRLQDAVDDHGSSPAYQAYAKKLLVQFKPIQDAVAGVPDFSAMVSTPVPENIKAVIDKVASLPTGDLEGAKVLLGQVVANNAHNPHIAAYAQAKLNGLIASRDAGFETLKDWPGTKYKLNASGEWEGHDQGISAGSVSVQGPELSSALFIKKGMPVPADVVAKLSDKSKAAIVKDAAAEFGMSTTDVQALLSVNSEAPKSPTAIPLHTFTGDGLESYVSHGAGKMAGKFSVSLKDTDAGQFVPTVTFYPTEAEAIKSAKAAAGVKDGPKEGDTKPGEDGSNLVFKNGRWHKYVDADEHGELPPVLVPVNDAAADSHKAAVAAMETGAFYQKEAVKKLKAEHGLAWEAIHPSKQHELAHAKYQALQGAASQAAAVSGWKKHMLAGQVPTPSEVKALAALASQDAVKVGLLMADVQSVIGGEKLAQLVAQAHAKLSKSPVPVAAKPAEPAKVFVTTPPVVAAKPQTLADKPAYAHMAQSVSSMSGNSLPAQKTFHKLAAQDWMAANPGKGAEMYEALVSHKISHLAALVGPGVHPAAPASTKPPKNEAKDKLSQPLQDFVMMFKFHGGPVAQGMSIDEMMNGSELATFNAATPVEKLGVAAAISFYGPHKLQLFQTWLGAQNAKLKKPAGPVPVVSQVFTNTSPGYNKFWSVSTHGSQMQTNYGKLGTQGAINTKGFSSTGDAIAAKAKLVDEKIAKGYKFAGNGTHSHEGFTTSAPVTPISPVAKVAPFAGSFSDSDSTYFVQGVADKFLADSGKTKQSYDEVLTELQSKGFGHLVSHYKVMKGVDHPGTQNEPIATVEAGPKDGDTKSGADGGTLVFKDGRWHKQGVVVPDFNAISPNKFGPMYANVADVLVATVADEGLAGLKKLITFHKSGNVTVTVPGYKFKNLSGNAKFNSASPFQKARQDAMHKLVMDLKAAAQKPNGKKAVFTTASPTAALKPAAAAQPVKATVSAPMVKVAAGKPPITVIDGWAKTGEQKGSNPGGKFKDKSGQEWYCKFPADIDVAMNELLAAKFYQMLGVSVPTLKLVEQGGKVGIASKWVDGISKGTAAQLAKAPGAHQAFALDAWLANWDVVGMSNDNLMLGKDGAAVRVDVGGSLVYRAMGDKKGAAFGDTVPELDTLKDANTNDKSAAVFGKVKDADMAWGLGQLNKMKPSQIEELCQKIGPGSDADKAALAKKLIARRAFILAKMGVRDQWTHIKVLDPTKLPVNPVDLPKPIDFANLNGPDKGLSSKAHVNAQNTLDSANMIAFAAKGDLTALKNYLYDAVDKDTGAALGKKPITDHPSSQIKNQWVGLVELLQSVSTPALDTLKMPSLGAASNEEEMSEMAGTFNPLDRVETVAAEHRMGFFMSVSQLDDVHELVAGYKWSHLTSASKFVKDAKAAFSGISGAVRAYIKKVQDSGAINHIWSQGKNTIDASGEGGHYSGGVHGLASKIYADAADIPEGTTLTRSMSDTTAGKSMTQQLLQATPGLVIQNTDSMCTSYKEGWVWGGDVVLTIRCGKGCKGTPSFASGRFGSEQEITTLPGQRFVVLSVKKTGSTANVELFMLPPHEGYVAELGKLEALGKAIVVFFKRMM